MAFDRNNPANLAALKAEIESDPAGVGYTPDVTGDLLSQINSAENNPGADTGSDFVTVRNLWSALFPIAISSQDQFKIQLVFEASEGLDADVSELRVELSALSTPIANAIAGIIRNLSRAEVLFSDIDANGSTEVVLISRDDWIAARNS